jgi:hypothetical protein
VRKTLFVPTIVPTIVPTSQISPLQSAVFNPHLTVAKTPAQARFNASGSANLATPQRTQKSPQNRHFTAIPRAKYNLSKPQLNFFYRKRAPGPSKIKAKYKL